MTTMSQDEINAMLSGVNADGNPEAEVAAEETAARYAEDYRSTFFTSDAEMLAHEPLPEGAFDVDAPEWQLSGEEVDVLGEVGNICMGAVATTMYTLLSRRCEITTPKVSVHTTHDVLMQYSTPFVVVEVEYIEGLDGKNLLLLKEKDSAMITDILMGGDGDISEPIELNELHMSAISEIMNQMIGASATAMAKVLAMPVNISPPQSVRVEQDQDMGEYLDRSQVVVKICFDMEIEGLLKSQLLQLIPFSLCRNLVRQVQRVGGIGTSVKAEPAPAHQPAPTQQPAAAAQQPAYGYPQQAPHQGAPHGAPAHVMGGYPPPSQPQPGNLVDVRPMQYQSFDVHAAPQVAYQGMGLVYDIPLNVSVELGKTQKDISEILAFGLGTVVMLDKVAGDPVEVLVNGKLIARGEVVVIDENYGVRITDILNG